MNAVRRLVPLANPQKILVDFEKAAMNAFALSFNATVTGCYFHLCQSVVKKVREIGLQSVYESNKDVNAFVRCLCTLAYVPTDDVVEAFELLADSQPEGIDRLDELTSFFEHTYIRGRRQRGRADFHRPPLFPVNLWNQHANGVDGVASTTNAVEGWHHKLQSLFMCRHPSLWSCMAGLQKDMQQQKAMFLQGTTGVEQASLKKYRQLNERVARLLRRMIELKFWFICALSLIYLMCRFCSGTRR
jgi:hypothetical protein